MSDSNGYIVRRRRHRPSTDASSRSRKWSAAASRPMPSGCPARSTSRAAAASGACPATSPCPAPPRTSWTPRRRGPDRPTASWRVCEGANMPSTPEAVAVFQTDGRAVCPGQGRQCRRRSHLSGLEMSQNSDAATAGPSRRWTAKLQEHHGGHLPQLLTRPPRSTAVPATSWPVQTSPASSRWQSR